MAPSGVLASKASSTYPQKGTPPGASVRRSALLDNILSSLAVKANQ